MQLSPILKQRKMFPLVMKDLSKKKENNNNNNAYLLNSNYPHVYYQQAKNYTLK